MNTQELETAAERVILEYVGEEESLYDQDGTLWEPIGGFGTEAGILWTPEKLRTARNQSRSLVSGNGFAINGLENRASYVIGTGHDVRVESSVDRKCSEGVVSRTRDFIREFMDRNQWRVRQIEMLRRYDRDGESIVRLFTTNGITTLRFVEPDLVQQPDDLSVEAPYGVVLADGDDEDVLGYFINGEYVDAFDIDHRKANVDLAAPRGVPLYYPVDANLRRVETLLKNMTVLAKIQSAIALIRKHKHVSGSGIEDFVKASADETKSVTDRVGGERYLRQYDAGTILDSTDDVDYDFPSTGVNAARFSVVLKCELRAIAARLVMPEFMFTSDASNSAYASTMVAEGPAVRMFSRIQCDVVQADHRLFVEVIRRGIAGSVLPAQAAKCVDILITPPSVKVKDFKEEAEVDGLAFSQGILSPQTWARKLGLDYEREQRNRDEAGVVVSTDQSTVNLTV